MRRLPQNVQNPVTRIWEAAITEEHVARDVDQVLNLNKAEFFTIRERIPYCGGCKRKIGRTSQAGIPDRMGFFPPKTVFIHGEPNYSPIHFMIELKRPGGKHRPMQDSVIQKAKAAGVIAFFCESRDQMVEEFNTDGVSLKIC